MPAPWPLLVLLAGPAPGPLPATDVAPEAVTGMGPLLPPPLPLPAATLGILAEPALLLAAAPVTATRCGPAARAFPEDEDTACDADAAPRDDTAPGPRAAAPVKVAEVVGKRRSGCTAGTAPPGPPAVGAAGGWRATGRDAASPMAAASVVGRPS